MLDRIKSRWYFQPDYERDLFLASFPRSGNTWLRAFFFWLESGAFPVSLREIDYLVIDQHYQIAKHKAKRVNTYSVVKTHSPCLRRPRRYIYVVRNPVESIISFYMYNKNTQSNFGIPLDEFAYAVLNGQVWPCSWAEHVRSWLGSQGSSHLISDHVIRYEDLISNDIEKLNECLLKILLFYPDINLDAARTAIRSLDRKKMKQLEIAGNRPCLERIRSDWFVFGSYAGSKDEARQIVARVIHKHGYDTLRLCRHFQYLA